MVRHVLVSNYPGDKHILLELSEDVPVLFFFFSAIVQMVEADDRDQGSRDTVSGIAFELFSGRVRNAVSDY